MNLHPIKALEPGKLAVLFFENTESQPCVGYVQRDGICEWPDNVSGRMPEGWIDLSAFFAGIPATVKRMVSLSL